MKKSIMFFLIFAIASSLNADFLYKDKVKEVSPQNNTITIGNYKYDIFKGCKGWKVGDEIIFMEGMSRNQHCLTTKAVNLSNKEAIVTQNEENSCILMCDVGKTVEGKYIPLDYIIGRTNKK